MARRQHAPRSERRRGPVSRSASPEPSDAPRASDAGARARRPPGSAADRLGDHEASAPPPAAAKLGSRATPPRRRGRGRRPARPDRRRRAAAHVAHLGRGRRRLRRRRVGRHLPRAPRVGCPAFWRAAPLRRCGWRFGNVDRHGCAASDVDGSGRPDLYCTVGGRRGSGVKSNQLWLDPAGPGRDARPARRARPGATRTRPGRGVPRRGPRRAR